MPIKYKDKEYADRWDYQLALAQDQLITDCARYGSKPNDLQWKWRGGPSWNGPLPKWDYFEVETALLDALVTQGGIPAWRGDGLGCAGQIVQYVYNKQQEKIDELEREVKNLKHLLGVYT